VFKTDTLRATSRSPPRSYICKDSSLSVLSLFSFLEARLEFLNRAAAIAPDPDRRNLLTKFQANNHQSRACSILLVMAETTQSDDRSDENQVQKVSPSGQPGHGLRGLAVEIRLEIFKYTLLDAIPGTTPAVVKALRGLQPLYDEVLFIWYQNSTMILGPCRFPDFYSPIDLSASALQLLRNLQVKHMV